jgi:hypothetical protein
MIIRSKGTQLKQDNSLDISLIKVYFYMSRKDTYAK